MSKNLVIVESPAKARTIGRFLGKSYVVKASMGHVRDLPKSGLGIETSDGSFEPSYRVMPDKRKIITELKNAVKTADVVYLATDPDREGEAISWHLMEATGIPKEKARRVIFHEVTEAAVQHAFDNPRSLNVSLINQQQARRMMDRLIGYPLSDVVRRKIRNKLSAGRVQSVALKLITDRENERNNFNSEEYWIIEALFSQANEHLGQTAFPAMLHSIDGSTVRKNANSKWKIAVDNESMAQQIPKNLSNSKFLVSSSKSRQIKERPSAPFITSTLQRSASTKLGFNAQNTMRVAQQLYEGIEVDGSERVGLITYMRTDSTNVSQAALTETSNFIIENFGQDYNQKSPRIYSKRVQGAQEAHEAIRPTSIFRTPKSLQSSLDKNQMRLYKLIWNRMVSSQMPDAEYDVTTLDITANGSDNKNYLFRASGRIEKFPGFKILTTSDEDSSEESDSKLPVISEKELLNCQKITPNQKFTQPPPRFNEASLIRTLEESGIGRPSTYASIINTIISRQYVERKQRALHPTNIGIAVSDFLNENFPNVIDVGFTAQIEEQLDNIDEGEQSWAPMLTEFYEDFEPLVTNVLEKADRVPREKLDEMTDHICSECNSPMVIRLGRNGKFIACTAFPECRQTMAIDENGEILPPRPAVEPEETEEICDKCNSPMVIKRRRSDNGKFMACSAYPKCRNAKSMPLGVKCPECEEGDIVERRSRRRGSRPFFGCNRYPDCEYLTNDPPITQDEKISTTSSNT